MSATDNSDHWVAPEETCRRLGLTPHRLRLLVSKHRLAVRGSRRDPFLREGDLERVRQLALGIADETELAQPPEDVAQQTVDAKEPQLDRLIVGDALDELRRLPSDIVQTVVTSPPFWGQRVYADETGVAWSNGQEVAFGREADPLDYVRHSVEVLSELARVIKPRGTIWWNIGDSYETRTILHGNSGDRIRRYGGNRSVWASAEDKRGSGGHEYLKDKDLVLLPFQVAIQAQRLGLWVRSVIVWSKQRPHTTMSEEETRSHMPEPVADRPVTGHEYILLFTKSESYDYYPAGATAVNGDGTAMNLRTVWSFRPADGAASHGARFPEELPRRCIQLASKRGELVLDPYAGYGTSLLVAASLGRRYLGIEISPTYAEQAQKRLDKVKVALPDPSPEHPAEAIAAS